MSLKNKIVLVAGGKSIAMISVVKMLLDERATLIVAAKSATDLIVLKDLATVGHSAKPVTFLVDYSDYYEAVEVIDQITETFGRIDACIFCFEPPATKLQLLETEITDWEKMVELNISAYYVAVRTVFDTMKISGQGLFVGIHEQLSYSDGPMPKLAQLSERISKNMAEMFFEELENHGIGSHHMFVKKAVDAENAGLFVLHLFGNQTSSNNDLLLPNSGK